MPGAGHVFVSYAHQDERLVAGEIARLADRGYRLWHDRRIAAGTEWADEIAHAIEAAEIVLFFATPTAARSESCRREINFAVSISKPFLAVHLEPTSMHGGLALALGPQQALLRWNLARDQYERQLDEALDRLLTGNPSGAPIAQMRGTHQYHGARAGRIWSVPFARNPHFMGRQALIERLEASLSFESPDRVVALTGLGGVGKTQLAVEIAHRFRHGFNLVAWLAAEDPEHLASELASLADGLELVDPSVEPTETRIKALMSYLDAHEAWLLIFDDVPTPAAIARYLPKLGGGKVLVTSRYQFWGNLARRVPVDVLEADEGAQLISRRTGRSLDGSVRQLAAELGGLPLALDCAASYMEVTGRDVASYLRLFHTYRDRIFEQGVVNGEHTASLPTTWDISLRRVAETHPVALELFRVFAFLGPDGIPIQLLRAGFAPLDSPLARLAQDDLYLDECIAALARFSLVSSDGGLVVVHRLVQLIGRQRNDDARRAAALALSVVEHVFPRSGLEGDARVESARLYPHAVAVIEHCDEYAECRMASAALLRRTGSYLSARGRHREGAEHLRRAAGILEQTGEIDTARFARTLGSLGLVEYALGLTAEARTHLTRAVEIYERLYGEDLHVAQELIGLAWVMRTEGHLAEAAGHIERSIAILERVLGNDSVMVTMPASAQSRIAYDAGRLELAATAAARCCALLASGDPIAHPLMTGTYNNVAQVLLDLGQIDLAQTYVERAIELGMRGYGEEHPLTAIAFGIRGSIARMRADWPAAVESLSRCLVSGAKGSILLHEDVVRRRSELGLCFLARSDLPAAREQIFTALAELEHLCGASNRVEGLARTALGEVHLQAEEVDAAIEQSTEAIRVLGSYFGDGHPIALGALRVQAIALGRQGSVAQARRVLERACTIGRLQSYPTYELGRIEVAFADLLQETDPAGARVLLERSFETLHTTLGWHHPETMVVRERLAAGGG